MAGQGELVQLYTGLRLDTALTWPLPSGVEAAKRWGVWDPGSQGGAGTGHPRSGVPLGEGLILRWLQGPCQQRAEGGRSLVDIGGDPSSSPAPCQASCSSS